MKHRVLIGVMVAVFLSACHRPVETVHAPSPHLVAIDSLMQSRPDSALEVLMSYSPDDPHDGHYAQLLASELLYKNNYAQTNRPELLEAMAYFDSIGDPFLSARCHYMNGVGYYEMDSVVPACGEYLKALEIMEDHYKEEELVGYKAKFMALTNLRICTLFSEFYLHEQAVRFGENSLSYYNGFKSDSWQIAWLLNHIGLQYHILGQLDIAASYFDKALMMTPDTTSLIYRDLVTARTMLSYHMGDDPQMVLNQLRYLLAKADNDTEYLSRCLTIGEVFYHELQYDSAWRYLNKVFEDAERTSLKKQAAEWLIDISKAQGKDDIIFELTIFLAPYANLEENNSELKSSLTELYRTYSQKKLERQLHGQQRKLVKWGGMTVLVLSIIAAVFIMFLMVNKKRLKNEQYAHRVQQNALGGRLKQKNMELKKFKEMKQDVSPVKDSQGEVYGRYSDEPICQYIIKKCNDKRNIVKSTVDVSSYSDIVLNDRQKAQLKEAAVRHYGALFTKIKARYPELKEKDYLYCYLCLLGLNNIQIAALLQKSISTIWDREKRLKRIFGKEENISMIINGFMND